jgi:hypothetical protein
MPEKPTGVDMERWPTLEKWAAADGKWEMPAYISRPPDHIKPYNLLTEDSHHPGLDWWKTMLSCPMTIDTGACTTVARTDSIAQWPDRNQSQCYKLKTVSREFIPLLKEADWPLGRAPPNICVIITKITDEFILWLGQEVSLWSPRAIY